MPDKGTNGKKPNLARQRLKEIKRWVIDTTTGEKKRQSFYGATLELALQSYSEFLNPPLAAGQGNTSSIDRMISVSSANSFAYVFGTEYLPLKTKKADSTLDDIQQAARHLLQTEIPGLGVFAAIPTRRITAGVIAQALDIIEKRVTLRNPTATNRTRNPEIWKPLSPRQVNKCRQLAIEVMQIAHETDQRNVPWINSRRIPKRKEMPKRIMPYTPGELRRLLETSRGRICFVPVILYGFLGMRAREGLGQSAASLHADGVLDVLEQQDRSDRDRTKARLKTDYAARAFPLPVAIVDELRPFSFGKDLRLARNTQGRAMRTEGVQRSIDLAARRAGLHRLTLHELRHTFSSFLDDASCPRAVRRDLMGHSRASMDERYNHARLGRMREWLQRLWDEGEREHRVWLEEREPLGLPRIEPPRLGTRTPNAGEANGRSILKTNDIPEIRRRLLKEKPSEIAPDYGVSPRAIAKIRDGRAWKDTA